MGYIDHISEFLFNKNERLAAKAGVVIILIIGVILIDNILGFSYHYNLTNKIETLKKLNDIIRDPTTDSITKSFAINERINVIERTDVFSLSLKLFKGKTTKLPKRRVEDSISKTESNSSLVRSNFWFNTSAGGLYFLLALITIPIVIFTEKSQPISQRLFVGTVTSVSMFLMGFFLLWLCNLIPQISTNTWLWNYILNSTIQVTIVILFFFFAIKNEN